MEGFLVDVMSVHGGNTWWIFLYIICAHSTNLQSSKMVEDGGCLSCVVWIVPDRSRDVWIDHQSSMANAMSRSVDRSVESGVDRKEDETRTIR